MWMNDYEYEFIKDSQEKKVTARSARSTRTHCGKSGAVRLPSDNLTKKELKAMSGEVIQYASLSKPMTWVEFKALPNDLKKEYVLWIREKFGAPDKYIAEMFGVSQPALALYLVDAGCASGKNAGNGNKKWAKQNFYAWRSGAEEGVVEAEEIEPENAPVEPMVAFGAVIPEPVVSKPNPVPVSGALDFSGSDIERIIPVLKALLHGPKIDFHVSWTIEGAE
jgi:hypothetical protein